MRSRTSCVVSFAVLMAGALLLAAPAAAQNYTYPDPTKKPAADSRKPPRVTVQKRSFLDAGTEVLPGQRKFTDYAFPPGYSPTAPIDFTTANIRGPLIGPRDPTRHNFYPCKGQAASAAISPRIALPISDVLTIFAPSDLMSAVRSPLASVAAIALSMRSAAVARPNE